jgi:PIN domain nuclease of toxin-antitoxin system
VGSARLNLLLDTHIWVWSHAAPERLAKRVTAALREATNRLWLSPISIWEFLLLAERGRLRPQEALTAAERLLRGKGFRTLANH